MNLSPPPQDDNSIITQFKPVKGQWELNDDNIKRIDPKTGHTILHNYCQHIKTTPIAVYRYLIEAKGCGVNIQDEYKDTPLHHALQYFQGGDFTVLTYLLTQKGINANIKGKWGYTILHTACKNINKLPLDIFKSLIETHGGDVNAQDDNNDTPLHLAIDLFNPSKNAQNVTTLTYLLTQTNINVNIEGEGGYTILHYACQHINKLPLDIFKSLIETHGGDVNARSDSNDTPLHDALKCFNPNKGGDITVLTYLLRSKDVNANIKGWQGYTLLHLACKRINDLPIDVFKALIETRGFDVNVQDNIDDTPLHFALKCFNPNKGGNITVLTYLLTIEYVNANIKGWQGYTLLHVACKKINSLSIDLFKVLIEIHGGDVNLQYNNNDTPIHIALGEFNPNDGGDITVLHYLLTHKGVNCNIKDEYGKTLLHYACKKINSLPLDVFKVLVETMGCDVTAQNADNDTPLHIAFVGFNPRNGGDISVLEYLFNQTKVHVNMKGDRGDTLLHYACENINHLSIDMFKVLIETMGCDVNVQNNDKDTPLHNAFRCFDPYEGGDITLLTYLLNQTKVHVNIKGKDGSTLLHYACEKIHHLLLEIFNLLIETHGSDVNIQDNNNDTPLHNAFGPFCPNFDGDLIPVLVYLIDQKDIDVNIKDQNGLTVLHLACSCEIGYDGHDDDYDGDDGDDDVDYDHNDDYDDNDDDDDDDDDNDDDDNDNEDDYSSDDVEDSDEGSEDSVIQNQEADANLCQIVEVIVERCLQQVLDENNMK
jgi:ankyrin repeat protein